MLSNASKIYINIKLPSKIQAIKRLKWGFTVIDKVSETIRFTNESQI